MDGLLRNYATGCRVDEAFTMDDLVDLISADTSGLRCGRVQLRIVFITPHHDDGSRGQLKGLGVGRDAAWTDRQALAGDRAPELLSL
ncbi:hypothetical protein DPX16_13827 [Anabarilius grahami]|uniref:Uncharacterized protein n=1 Tax=Anabarilius grahami TaxID=495550 RepID=A0A3N0XTK4_ANAGA|nr:hypothetical protein DPX16_13827 [Anabarilius grahami]